MRIFLVLVLTLIMSPSLLYGDDKAILLSQIFSSQRVFLNEPLLYPQLMEKQKANYYRFVYDPLSNPIEATKSLFTITLNQLRHPHNAIAMNRFDKSRWIPELLEKAKNDPWNGVEDEIYDSDVDEVELVGIITAGTNCVLNAFKKFDIYSSYVKDGYFVYSYALNEHEEELLKLKPTDNNELYHYSIFYPSSLIGAYQSIVKYQIAKSHSELKVGLSTKKIPKITIAWELIPTENFSPLPGRGDKASRAEENAWRDGIDSTMLANSGYMIFEPLIIDKDPQGDYEECSKDNICVKKKAANEETFAHGIFYLKPDLPLGNYPFIRQNIMDAIMTAIFSGLRDVIRDSKNEKIIKTIDGTLQPLIIEGCK